METPRFSSGDRIKVLVCNNDPAPIPPGATGTVTSWNDHPSVLQLDVDWDPPHSHRRLALTLTPGDDQVELIRSAD